MAGASASWSCHSVVSFGRTRKDCRTCGRLSCAHSSSSSVDREGTRMLHQLRQVHQQEMGSSLYCGCPTIPVMSQLVAQVVGCECLLCATCTGAELQAVDWS